MFLSHTAMVWWCLMCLIAGPTEYAILVFILEFSLGSAPQLQINSVSLPLTSRKLIGKPTPRWSEAAGCWQDGWAEIQSQHRSHAVFSAKISKYCNPVQSLLVFDTIMAPCSTFYFTFRTWFFWSILSSLFFLLTRCSCAIDQVMKFQSNCWFRLCFHGSARRELWVGFSRSTFSPLRA